MNCIKFYDIKRTSKRIDLTVNSSIDNEVYEEKLYFEFSCDNIVSDTALILVFISLIMKNFDEVHIELCCTSRLKHFIEEETGSKLYFKEVVEGDDYYLINKINKGNVALLFSGGIDSLAALKLLDNSNLKLISIDFGGIWEIEKKSFLDFKPYILKTNFRNSIFFKYTNKKYLPFFSVAALLYAEKLKISYVATGEILEAYHDFNCPIPNFLFPSSYFNFKQLRPTTGMTEIATAYFVKNQYNKNIIKNSIESLAKPGTTKRLRKDVLLNFVGLNIPINNAKRSNFGLDYVLDFLFLHIKKYNSELASKLFDNTPNEVNNFIDSHTLNFYKKVNLRSLRNFQSDETFNYYVRNIFNNNMSFYGIQDYKELYETREFLSKIYNENNNNFI